jgi:hypothetical protein
VADKQRAIVNRRSLAVANNTPVTIVADPADGTISARTISAESPEGPVRVRVTGGAHRGIELIVRRQDLTYPAGPADRLAGLVPVAVIILIAAAGTFWSIETIWLVLRYRRELSGKSGLGQHHAAPMPRQLTRLLGPRATDRGASEWEQWRASVAAMTARRKVRCTSYWRRSMTPSH